MTEIRKKALEWWDLHRNTELSRWSRSRVKDKGYFTFKYFGWNMRMWEYLSEDEIEMIYKYEHGLAVPPPRDNDTFYFGM